MQKWRNICDGKIVKYQKNYLVKIQNHSNSVIIKWQKNSTVKW